ncbi:amino acid ABC transporter substrate-binding protein [Hydrogenobacter thermophilus]|uniref:amino acid ABC transporter substrate-binding protein n=1 Tax=Hydrogenobacter thermophilus TaxID=940 RepID=UPI0030F85026
MRVLLAILFLLTSFAVGQDIIKFGAAISLTGKLAKEGQLLKRGYEIWKETVNAQGGIKVGGKHYKVDLVYYDDQSDPVTSARLIERLIVEDHIKFILGPYGSAQVFSSAPVVEKYGAIMVQAGGASSDIYQKGYRNIFGLYTIAPDYGRDLVELATRLDKSARKIAILYEKDIFSEDAAEGALQHAKRKGLEVVLYEGYPKQVQDLSSLMQKIRLLKPDIVIGSGHFQDSVLMVKQLKQFRINPKFLGLTVGPALPAFVEALGQDAEGIFGPVQWSPALRYRDPVFGSNQEFVKFYRERFGSDPEYHVAGAVAAGIVFQKAIEEAKSTDVVKVRDALRRIKIETLFGLISFDTSGRVITKPMAVIQIQRGKQVTVYPFEEAKPIYPKPQWR